MLSRCFPKTDPEWTSTPLLPSSRQNRVVCDRNCVWRLKITQNHTFWNEKSHNHTKLRHRPVCDSFQECVTTKITQSHQTQNHTFRHRPVCDSFQECVTKKLHLHISKLHLHKSGRFPKPAKTTQITIFGRVGKGDPPKPPKCDNFLTLIYGKYEGKL